MKPIILAGGGGTRLWPISRQDLPKPFVSLLGASTLFSETVKRIDRVCPNEIKTVVCGQDHRRHVFRELHRLGLADTSRVIVEPDARNTAPAVLLAVLTLLKENGDGVVGVFPADHLIEETDAFCTCMELAREAAEDGHVVTFGIPPTHPETGFGYMEVETEPKSGATHDVLRFIEKPNSERAEKFCASSRFFWNSGIFVFRAATMIEAFKRLQQDLYDTLKAYADGKLSPEDYSRVPKISLDVAIMEKLENIKLIPATFSWSDVGSWASVHQVVSKHEQENVVKGRVELQDCSGCTVQATHRLVVGLDLKDAVVVETSDAVLVASRKATQKLGKLVDELGQKQIGEALQHPHSVEEWGSIQLLETTPNAHVRRLEVNPQMSMPVAPFQRGKKTWTVVSGHAEFVTERQVRHLTPAATLQLPPNTMCEVSNPEKHPLIILEVWTKD